jgi:Integrase core domain
VPRLPSSREIVGWSLELRCGSEEASALVDQAVAQRRVEPGGLTLGTDNGSAFTSRGFRNRLAEHGVTHRRGGYRDPESQAFIESWFGKLQERLVWRSEFETLDQARKEIATYIDRYHQRPHCSLASVRASFADLATSMPVCLVSASTSAFASRVRRFSVREIARSRLPTARERSCTRACVAPSLARSVFPSRASFRTPCPPGQRRSGSPRPPPPPSSRPPTARARKRVSRAAFAITHRDSSATV